MRLSYRQLQGKVEELSEERSLQNFNTTSTSLLSEIEQSMEAEELEQEREQVFALWPLEKPIDLCDQPQRERDFNAFDLDLELNQEPENWSCGLSSGTNTLSTI